MVYTPEGFTENSTRLPMTPTQVKKPSARKSMCIFTNILYVKKKTIIRRDGAAKSNQKLTKAGTTLWAKKTKQKLNSKINDQIKKFMRHPQVVQSPISIDFLKVSIGGTTRPQIVPKLLLQVSVR